MDVSEKTFLTTIIDDFIQVILALPRGLYGKALQNLLIYDAKATGKETIQVTPAGMVYYIFRRITKKPYPSTFDAATSSDIALINDIWNALGYPNNTFEPMGNGQPVSS